MASTKDMMVFLALLLERIGLTQGKRIGDGSSISHRRPGLEPGPITTAVHFAKSVCHRISTESATRYGSRLKAGTTCGGSYGEESSRSRGRAAVDHDRLAGHEGRGVGGEIGYRAGDLVGFADPAQRRGGGAVLQPRLVFPQRAGEIGLDEARRYAIDAHAFRAPFAGEAAAQ